MLDWVFLHAVINRNDVSSLCDGRKQSDYRDFFGYDDPLSFL
jgi:hypothetical protein